MSFFKIDAVIISKNTEAQYILNGVVRNGNPYTDALNTWGYAMIIIKPTFLNTEVKAKK